MDTNKEGTKDATEIQTDAGKTQTVKSIAGKLKFNFPERTSICEDLTKTQKFKDKNVKINPLRNTYEIKVWKIKSLNLIWSTETQISTYCYRLTLAKVEKLNMTKPYFIGFSKSSTNI